MRMPRLAAAVVGLTLMVGACGDSTGPQIELSEAEAQELFEVIDAIIGGLEFSAARANPGLPGLMLSRAGTPPVNESASCDGGGNVSVSGNVSESQTGIDYDVTLAFNNCQDEGYTVDGDLNYSGEGTFTDTSFSFSFDLTGTLTVTLPDNRTGNCTIDLNATFNAQTASVTGKICGRDYSESGSF